MRKVIKTSIFSVSLLISLNVMSCQKNVSEFPDYSKTDSWFRCEYTGESLVDLFYISPSMCDTTKSGTNFCTFEEMRDAVEMYYTLQTNTFIDYTNAYVPLYRQSITSILTGKTNEEFLELIKNNVPYQDVEKALDYYFEHYNGGKPFILAGHSQGSAVMVHVVSDYMKRHPNYQELMVAAYMIGFAPSKKLAIQYSNVKFATKEDDVGVIISYNTYGPNHDNHSILIPEDAYVINPLNWKTDETLATVNENKGTLFGYEVMTPGLADAQIDATKGLLKCTTFDYYSKYTDLFGSQSLHGFDYPLFYQNLHDNGLKRIEAYYQLHPEMVK